jgi:hypothetical protein
MKNLRLRTAAAIGAMLASTALVVAATANRNVGRDAVTLPRVEVRASRPDFEFDVKYDDVSLKVQKVVVTWVSPATHRQGLRVGDRMKAMDAQEVTTLSLEQILAAAKRKLGPGESQVMVFTGTRALIRPVTVTYTANGPNKAPEPTTTPVTSPTPQESRQP